MFKDIIDLELPLADFEITNEDKKYIINIQYLCFIFYILNNKNKNI